MSDARFLAFVEVVAEEICGGKKFSRITFLLADMIAFAIIFSIHTKIFLKCDICINIYDNCNMIYGRSMEGGIR